MSDFFDSLPPAEQRLLERATDLRAAREAAEQALRSGDEERMRAALARLEKARRAAKEVAP